jgi:hypothetical protein
MTRELATTRVGPPGPTRAQAHGPVDTDYQPRSHEVTPARKRIQRDEQSVRARPRHHAAKRMNLMMSEPVCSGGRRSRTQADLTAATWRLVAIKSNHRTNACMNQTRPVSTWTTHSSHRRTRQPPTSGWTLHETGAYRDEPFFFAPHGGE